MLCDYCIHPVADTCIPSEVSWIHAVAAPLRRHSSCICCCIGMIAKKDFHSPWVAYSKEGGAGGKERYRMRAAFDPYMPPDPTVLSEVFTTSRDDDDDDDAA